eukprot:2405563-Prymnesium_polylepis.1
MVSCRASARLHCLLTRIQTYAAVATVLPVAEASQPSAQEHTSTTLARQHDGTACTVARCRGCEYWTAPTRWAVGMRAGMAWRA